MKLCKLQNICCQTDHELQIERTMTILILDSVTIRSIIEGHLGFRKVSDNWEIREIRFRSLELFANYIFSLRIRTDQTVLA